MDGHSGIENNEVNRAGSGNFQLVLSYLKESGGRGYFVIHATSGTFYSAGLQPLQFLQQIGFSHFGGECKFHHDRCFYRYFAEIEYDDIGFESSRQTMYIHSAFEKFAKEGISKLYELQRQQNSILGEIRASSGDLPLFGALLKIKPDPSAMPVWIYAVKFKRLQDLEGQRIRMNKEIENLGEFLPLVYADGDLLQSAVIKSLRLMGLKAELTQPGFTADILAETNDGLMKFGFEVTGTTEAIKKDSKKLTQLLEFERIKEHNEKTILIANTFKNLPTAQRQDKENFTRQVVEFLSRFPILLMTGWDLYRVVEDVLEGIKSADSFVERFYNETGIFIFNK
jgi:hypothetical protein